MKERLLVRHLVSFSNRQNVSRGQRHHPVPLLQRRYVSTDEKTVHSSSVDDQALTPGISEKILKAPFQRVDGTRPPLFPWRHSQAPLPRLDPNEPEYAQGQLLGANMYSAHPLFDEIATAWMFLNVPWHQMLFFRAWEEDLSENMSWAFTQGVSGILSNVYRVPMNQISKGDSSLSFDYQLETNGRIANDNEKIVNDTDYMIEPKLRKLYESAHEFGKDSLQVCLDCRPKSAKIYNMFAFPFLSRANLKRTPGLKEQYQELLQVMSVSPREALPIYHEFVTEMQQRGKAENTVICQVVVNCDELFWVKDLNTGVIVQGHEDEKFRPVQHLVRMEMVVETVPRQHPIIPFEMVTGSWQMTDLDDHLGGNLMI